MIHNSSAPAMHGASSRLRGFSDQALAMGQCAPYFYCGSSFAHEVKRLGLMVSEVDLGDFSGGIFRLMVGFPLLRQQKQRPEADLSMELVLPLLMSAIVKCCCVYFLVWLIMWCHLFAGFVSAN